MTVEENLETGLPALPRPSITFPDHIYDLFSRLREHEWRGAGPESVGRATATAWHRAGAPDHAPPGLAARTNPPKAIQPNVDPAIGDAFRYCAPKGIWGLGCWVEQNADFAYALGDSFIVVEGGPTARAS